MLVTPEDPIEKKIMAYMLVTPLDPIEKKNHGLYMLVTHELRSYRENKSRPIYVSHT